MGKIEINLDEILLDLKEMDGFFRGYFKIKIHDYHNTIKNCKAVIEKEKEKE